MKRPVLLTILLFIFCTPLAHAYENYALLADEDQRSFKPQCDTDGEVINQYLWNKEPRHQGNIGVCYAHSAATIYAALYFAAFGIDLNPSPLMLSLRKKVMPSKIHFSKKTIAERISGGHFVSAFRKLTKTRYCPTSVVEGFLNFPNAGYSAKHALELALSFLKHYHSFGKSRDVQQAFGLAITMVEKDGFFLNKKIVDRLTELAEYVDRLGYTTSFMSDKQPYFKKTLAHFFEHRCASLSESFIPQQLPTHIDSSTYHGVLAGRLHKKIVRHFASPADPPVELSFKISRLQPGPERGYHSAIIYGWQCKAQRLFFLVRNSWGGSSLRKQRQDSGEPPPLVYNAEADLDGDFWLSKRALTATLDPDVNGVTMISLRR